MNLNNKIINAINTGVQNALNEKFGVIDIIEDIFNIFYEKFIELSNNHLNADNKNIPDIEFDYTINDIQHTFIFKSSRNTDVAGYALAPEGSTNHFIYYRPEKILSEKTLIKEVLMHEIRHAIDNSRKIKNAYLKKLDTAENEKDKKIYHALNKLKHYTLYQLYEMIIHSMRNNDFDELTSEILWQFEPVEHAAMLQALSTSLDNMYDKIKDNLLYRSIVLYYLKFFANMIAMGKNIRISNKILKAIRSIGNIGCTTFDRAFNQVFDLFYYYVTSKKPIDSYILLGNKQISSDYTIFYNIAAQLCVKYNCNTNDVYKLCIVEDNIDKDKNLDKESAFNKLKMYYYENVSNKLNAKANEYFKKYFNNVEKIICEFLYQHPFKKYVVNSKDEYEQIKKIKVADMNGVESVYHDMLLSDIIDMDEILDLSKIK